MAAVLAFQGYLRVLKDNGDVCADAKATWYVAGTTTPTDTYTTSALSVANANPVEANALGVFPEMWLSPSVSYKVVISGTGVTTRTIDNVYGSLTVNQLENDVRYIGLPGGAAYTTTGSSNAYVVTTGLSLSALSSFSTLLVKANFTNTGPANLNVDGIGAKSVYAKGAALTGGEIVSGRIYQVTYDGTQFQLVGADIGRVVTQVFTSSGTYTPTGGMLFAIIECVGGGGGGGGCANSTAGNQGGAGGGGGGAYSRKVVTAADIGASKTVTIGAGGAGGAAGNNNGVAGGDTSVGTLCVAKGGSAANGAGSNSTSNGGSGGLSSTSTGDVTVRGETGADGGNATIISITLDAGHGGAAARGFGFGGRASNANTNNVTGGAGNSFGGGGAGGKSGNGAGSAGGGAGGQGYVVITEFYT